MTSCSVPAKSESILTTRLVKKYSSMTKRFMVNLNLKLLGPLTFLGSPLTALWQFHCGLVLWNVSMFATPCLIRSPHLCNLIWNPCVLPLWLRGGRVLCPVAPLLWFPESSNVDSHASFFGSLWCHEHMPCMCSCVLLLFCLFVHWTPCLVLNQTFHNSKIPLLKTGYIICTYIFITQ